MSVGRILPSRVGPKIGSIQVTGSIRQVHTRSARISEHPIQDGSTMSDHRIREPFRLEMDCIISGVIPLRGSVVPSPVALKSLAEQRIRQAKFVGPPTPEDWLFPTTLDIDSDATTDAEALQFAESAYIALLKLDEDSTLCEVVTGIDIYRDMQFERLVINKDQKTGRSIGFTAAMAQAVFSSSRSAVVPLSEDRDKLPPSDFGEVPTSEAPAPTAEDAASAFQRLVDFIRGLQP